MPTLFSYCIPYDNGSAPNPFWELCTLAICKPQIRRHAEVGDWVVGTGSTASPIGDVSGMVVYAMLVTEKMTMEEYDRFTQAKLPRKIPLMNSADLRRQCGDSIYDYSTPTPSLRLSVHSEDNQSTDLDGYYVLLSNHFFYFGDRPVALPVALQGIVKQGQGHKSRANAPYFDDFVRWIHSLGYPPGTLIGEPQGGRGWITEYRTGTARPVGGGRPNHLTAIICGFGPQRRGSDAVDERRCGAVGLTWVGF